MADTLREHPRPESNSNGQIVSTNNNPAAALTAHPGGRYDLDTETFVAGTLKSQRGKGGGGIGPEETLVYQESEYGVKGYDTAGTLREGRIPEHQMIAAPLTKGSATGEGVNQPGRRQEDDVNIVAYGLNTNRGGNADMCVEEELAPPVTGSHGNPGGVMQVQAFSWQQGDDSKFNSDGRGRSWVARAGDYAAGLSASGRHDAISGESVGVRRLTPTECERLQGFSDSWTQLGKTPDSRRYSALGDAVTVNVAEWIGSRLADHTEAETGVDSQPPSSPQGDTGRRKEDATP